MYISFTPEELIRLEILCYETPEGLHPIEKSWRDLARKLKNQLVDLQQTIEEHNEELGYSENSCRVCQDCEYRSFKFPEAFRRL